MVKKTDMKQVSDLSGELADETVRFSLDQAGYEIDLTEDEAAQLRALLAPYIAVARRPSRRTPKASEPSVRLRRGRGAQSGARSSGSETTKAQRRTYSKPAASNESPGPLPAADPAEVRAWAIDAGYAVGHQGRIARHVLEAYAAAHPKTRR